MKLIMNFIGLSYVNIYAIAFPLAQKMGIDLNQAYEIISTTGMGCGTFNFYAPKMIDKSYKMAFALELALKDLTYCKHMYEEYEIPCFALDGTLDLLRTAMKEGKGKMDYSACISLMYDFFEKKP
jgi:3-hydroxyisobutyrate dehydrogenase-like beta-hydroxyacid dehydrogenase